MIGIFLVSQSRYYIDVLTDEFKDINKTIEPIEDNTDYFSDIRKHFYKSILELRYNKILIPTLEKIFHKIILKHYLMTRLHLTILICMKFTKKI